MYQPTRLDNALELLRIAAWLTFTVGLIAGIVALVVVNCQGVARSYGFKTYAAVIRAYNYKEDF